VRLGTPAMTTRGFGFKEFDYVCELFDEGVRITKEVMDNTNFGTLREFK